MNIDGREIPLVNITSASDNNTNVNHDININRKWNIIAWSVWGVMFNLALGSLFYGVFGKVFGKEGAEGFIPHMVVLSLFIISIITNLVVFILCVIYTKNRDGVLGAALASLMLTAVLVTMGVVGLYFFMPPGDNLKSSYNAKFPPKSK